MIYSVLLFLSSSSLFFVEADPVAAAKTISSDLVLALTECHLKYEYRDGPPKRIQEYGPQQRDNFMRPFFGIEQFIEECMDTKQELVRSEFFALQKHIFDISGFSTWKEHIKTSMAQHYDEIGKNVKYLIDGKTHTMTQFFWREMLVANGFAVQDVYFAFAKIVLNKLLKKLCIEENVEVDELKAMKWLSSRLDQDITNQELVLSPHTLTGKRHMNTVLQKYSYGNYLDIFNKVNRIVGELSVVWKAPESLAAYQLTLPKPKRVIWVVRHSERFDDLGGRKTKGCLLVNGRVFSCDNSPLSQRGRDKAAELQKIFAKIPVNHIFACPYERNVETAHQLLGELNVGMKIKPEPGFLRKCTDAKTESCEALQKHHKRLDCEYKPVHTEFDCERESAGIEGILTSLADALMPRLADVMDKIFGDHDGQPSPQLKEPYNQAPLVQQLKEGTVQSEWLAPGEEDAEHIVIVTHGTVTVALEQLFDGKFTFAPMISITKFVELEDPGQPSIFERIHLIHASELRHRYDKEKETQKNLEYLFVH